jgi:hypothetical protein
MALDGRQRLRGLASRQGTLQELGRIRTAKGTLVRPRCSRNPAVSAYGFGTHFGVTSAASISFWSLTPMIVTVLSGTRTPGRKEIEPVTPW